MKATAARERIWKLKNSRSDLSSVLSQSLNVSSFTALILLQRGIENAEKAKPFLECRLKDLGDPFLFEGMDQAVKRIFQAVDRGEKILVHGDYDVDGITGTALLCELFQRMGLQAQPYIPDRVSEGYGISREAIDRASKEGVRLMITVDCGGSAFDELEEARQKGLDVIVVDHHELKESLPNCVAVLHPRRVPENVEVQSLAAVGVAFKLAHGVIKEGLRQGRQWAPLIDLRDFLDRVAIGTIADLVPLRGENKIFVKRGLERLLKTECVGLAALLKEIGISERALTSSDIAFKIAPRLNAAGRVGTAYDAIRLLLCKDSSEALVLAKGLDHNNRQRQLIEQNTFDEALQFLEEQSDSDQDWVLVLHKDQWPLGVIGIVASRIVKLRHRPTFIISADDDVSKGSARSIHGFHLCHALKNCEDLLVGYGGHACAAGIKIKKEKIPDFRKRLNEYARQILSENDLIPTLEIDLEIPIGELSLKLVNELEMLSPFGQENPTPLFLSQDLVLDRKPQVVGNKHLKLWLKKESAPAIEGIAFGMAEWFPQFESYSEPFQAVYEIGINTYGGQSKLQLNFKDFKLNNESQSF